MKKHALPFVGLLCLIVFVLLAGAALAGSIACGDTVVLDKKKVVLGQDILNCAANPALRVIGPGTFDMDGHGLSCVSGGSSDGLVVAGSKAKVENGVVKACQKGVTVFNSGHTIRNMVAKGNGNHGFENAGPKNTFMNNTASGNGNSGFSNTAAGSSSKFLHNVAVGNGTNGFSNAGDRSIFTRNTATANQFAGFSSTGANCRFTDNTAGGNLENGFVNFGDHAKFTDNAAIDSFYDGFVETAGNSSYVRNRAMNNGYAGIRVTSGANGNRIKKTIALGNVGSDLTDDNAACDSNTWQKNVFGTSQVAGGANPGCIQ